MNVTEFRDFMTEKLDLFVNQIYYDPEMGPKFETDRSDWAEWFETFVENSENE